MHTYLTKKFGYNLICICIFWIFRLVVKQVELHFLWSSQLAFQPMLLLYRNTFWQKIRYVWIFYLFIFLGGGSRTAVSYVDKFDAKKFSKKSYEIFSSLVIGQHPLRRGGACYHICVAYISWYSWHCINIYMAFLKVILFLHIDVGRFSLRTCWWSLL